MQAFPTIRLAVPTRVAAPFDSPALVQRKLRLRNLIDRSESPSIIYAQHIETNGTKLYQEICKRDLEGIVCKRKRSEYSANGWLKVLNPKYTQHEGRHEMFTKFRGPRTKDAQALRKDA